MPLPTLKLRAGSPAAGTSTRLSGLGLGLLLTHLPGPAAAVELQVADGQRSIQAEVLGEGQPLVLIPSLGRGAQDFDDLKQRLRAAGYQIILPQPRGIAGSRGALTDLTLNDLAEDVHLVVSRVTERPVVVIGHAFGNRVARTFATRYPERTRGVVLLAAGGATPIPPTVAKALRDSFRTELPDAEHMAAVHLAFFADRNDPAVWRDGWYPQVAQYQEAANHATPRNSWWSGGTAPLLVIQAVEDRVAPQDNARQLQAAFPQRVQVQLLANAGHAMLPEQPQAIATQILQWLAQHR